MEASKEILDLINVAHFTDSEHRLFLQKIEKKLSEKGITLDCL
jgi:hypothetical protein